jgi:hypothetical protein
VIVGAIQKIVCKILVVLDDHHHPVSRLNVVAVVG